MSREVPDPSQQTSLHLQRAKMGDRDSLNWLVDRLSPLLLAQAKYRLGRRLSAVIEAEDLVQEVWATVYPRLSDLQAREGRETPVLLRFLSTTLLNQVNNLARRARRAGVGGEQGKAVDEATADGDKSAAGPGPATMVAAEEQRAQVLRCINELPGIHREILILRGIEQQEIADIAMLLELEANTVAQRWHRALEQLRENLPDSVFDELD